MRWSVTRTGGGASRRRRLLLTGAMALALTGCSVPSSVEVVPIPVPSMTTALAPSLETFYAQQLTWRNCGDAECTTVKVPIDYANPDERTIDLAVTRVRSTGTAIGSGTQVTAVPLR